MWRKGKKRTDDSSTASGGDSNKFARPDPDENGITVCELSKNRKVSVRSWHGKIGIDIREFYVKDGQQLPGKKGISLPLDQWETLREHIDEINEAMAGNA